MNARRTLLAAAAALAVPPARAALPEADWYAQALRMRALAESWGDQSYGAVLVKDGAIVGWGPSRVVRDRNPDAHAEREAIRDAVARHGTAVAAGALLVSTSRPCAACEAAAARAGVARMVFGAQLTDAGAPRALP